jgi:F-type H+-transporting ATPase subunit gamma
VKNVGYIVVSSDRGLCRRPQRQLFRKLLADESASWQEQGRDVDVVTIGQKATVFFRRLKVNMLALGHPPRRQAARGAAGRHDQGDAGRLPRRQGRPVFLSYNDFVNTMTQKPTFDQLLPLPSAGRAGRLQHDWDYSTSPARPRSWITC